MHGETVSSFAMADRPTNPAPAPNDAAFRGEVERLIGLIRPAVQADGGDVELVSADPAGLVRIRFHGACVGCPSSSQTLHHGIERTLRTRLGGQIRVEAVASAATSG